MTDLNQQFRSMFSLATAHIQGEALKELLQESTIPECVKKSDPYKTLEAIATILTNVNGDPHPWLYGQMRGAWGALLYEIEHEANMADAIAREKQWYVR